MNAQVYRTEQANLDLLEIWLFIAEDTTEAADSFIDLLEDKARMLATAPEMGRLRPELAAGSIHSFPVGKYVLFYEIVPEGVLVVRVLHGAREVDLAF